MTSMRMRFLLISDTHGKLGIIDELASHIRSDIVIHAGDFGFYDDGSSVFISDCSFCNILGIFHEA